MVKLKPLPYDYEDFSPVIGKEALIEHHQKHHKGYVDKLNEALKPYPELLNRVGGLEVLLGNPKHIPLDIKTKVVNFGGGVYTHDLFWSSISPQNTEPFFKGAFKREVEDTFGGLYSLKKEIVEKGLSHFGSGWVWLVITKDGLKVQTLDNQLTPLMRGHYPLLCIDLWEHAYYLDHKSDRAMFLKSIVSNIDWVNVQKRFMRF